MSRLANARRARLSTSRRFGGSGRKPGRRGRPQSSHGADDLGVRVLVKTRCQLLLQPGHLGV